MISYPKTNRDADGVKARECQPTVLTRKFEFAAARLRSWPTTAILTHQHGRDLHPDVLIQLSSISWISALSPPVVKLQWPSSATPNPALRGSFPGPGHPPQSPAI